MKDSKVNNNSRWQNLDWEKKVTICNQSIANEDSLLLTLVIMFVALEAILFTILIGVGWGQWWSIILAVFGGIVVVIPYMLFFEIRGNRVDYWGENLYWLWKQVGESELLSHYKGCVERRHKRKEKCGRWKVTIGWNDSDKFGRFKSTRRLFTTFIPLILVIVWILVMVVSFIC